MKFRFKVSQQQEYGEGGIQCQLVPVNEEGKRLDQEKGSGMGVIGVRLTAEDRATMKNQFEVGAIVTLAME